ncbi:hypothetical protein KK083_07385 [Fulvivirgaceae bacterium PWU4]|uniref:Uncharacterized protein n=1 Tax=Chryseosolibacter histidini TaxID=2782349 RepID=A0AAP2DIB0_9BACT|nr:hypothetical protein [Chryseosolibacter histidini]MBT1696690.1 hypothetical protein [Chryseosolibacter histidini]
MKNAVHLIAAVFILASAGTIQGQVAVKLRKTIFENTKEAEKPASVTATFPEEKDEFIAIHAALGIGIENQTTTFMPMVEWHYNNIIDKPQNNVKAGLMINGGRFLNAIVVDAATTWNNDRIKEEEKLQGMLTVFPVLATNVIGGLTPNTWHAPGATGGIISNGDSRYFWKPSIGFNYDRIYQASPESKNGNIARYALMVVFEANFLQHQYAVNISGTQQNVSYSLLGTSISFQYLKDFHNNIEEKTDHPLLNATIYVNLSKDREATSRLGVDFVRGRDPLTGLAWQQYYAVSFKIKI